MVAALVLVGSLNVLAQAAGGAAEAPDRLGEALKLVGFSRDDLGYRPKGYWSRYPNPDQMPYKLPFFDDLFAEPLRVYEFTAIMAMAVQAYLAPEGLAKEPKALYQLVYFLGVDRRTTGFRSYGANLDPQVDENAPLVRAIERVYAATGTRLTEVTFGLKPGASWRQWDTDAQQDLANQAARLDPALQKPLAALVLNVLDAYLWRQRAIRNVRHEDLYAVFSTRDLPDTHSGSRVYHFEIDDLAKALDEQSLYYAGMKAVQAADDARRAFAAVLQQPPAGLAEVRFDFLTPIGRIVLAGTGNDTHGHSDAAVLVDLGGNDRYTGAVGATTSLDLPVSIAIDCAGDDLYDPVAAPMPTQGAGILGAGVLIDAGGNDTYRAGSHAQGLGLFGLGLLFDQEGDDSYSLTVAGQGAGYFGLGYLFDVSGNDRFYLHGDGQGYGGPGGVGVLANYAGEDQYVAEPDATKTGRPDYHSEGKTSISQAQGVGAGRRGDGSDGHNWAGGLGLLVDLLGNDTYEAGNFSIGLGYWYGTGLLYDGAGNDTYRSVYFTQGSGAHFCIGALIDEEGDDRHVLSGTGGAGLAFGWDFAVALLIDKGGNDYYEALGNSLGRADIRSNALLIDIGGADTYAYTTGAGGRGAAPFQENYRKLGYAYGPYNFYANSFGLLLDIGGTDQYLDIAAGSPARSPSAEHRDNHVWQDPAPGSPNYGFRNFGVGMDVPDGTVPELFSVSPKEPPASR
jgi:hypothetical protein